MHGYYVGNMMGWGVAGGAFMMFFWVAIVIFIAWIFKGSNEKSAHHTSSALDILKERYAKGEINKEEFQMKKTDLLA